MAVVLAPGPVRARLNAIWLILRPILTAFENVANVLALFVVGYALVAVFFSFRNPPDVGVTLGFAAIPIWFSLFVTVINLVRTIVNRSRFTVKQMQRRLWGLTLGGIAAVGALWLIYGANAILMWPTVLVLLVIFVLCLLVAVGDLWYTSNMLV